MPVKAGRGGNALTLKLLLLSRLMLYLPFEMVFFGDSNPRKTTEIGA